MGNVSYAIKRGLSAALNAAGIPLARIRRLSKGAFLILTYHRIISRRDAGDWVQPGLVTEPETFRSHLIYLKEHFDIMPLCDIVSSHASPRPRCAITFDDGWIDFFEVALPMLRDHGIPATVFLPTDYIGTDRWQPTDTLAYFIRAYVTKISHDNSAIFTSANRDVARLENIARTTGSIERCIAYLKEMPRDLWEDALDEWSGRLQTPRPRGRLFMSWDEARTARASGVVEFGSHGTAHRDFRRLRPDEKVDELRMSKEALLRERVSDDRRLAFCYPYGHSESGMGEAMKREGYILAVTGKSGWNAYGSDPFALNRISIHQDMARNTAIFSCRLGRIL